MFQSAMSILPLPRVVASSSCVIARRWALSFASAFTARGQKDRAFELERVYATKDSARWAFKGHPWLKSLEQDARYEEFLRKMNLPE